MSTPELLREIADVMEERPKDGFEEFQFANFYGNVCIPENWEHLLSRVAESHKTNQECWVRRRSRTIKVSGEVPEEAVDTARSLINSRTHGIFKTNEIETTARALLDLIEQSGGE